MALVVTPSPAQIVPDQSLGREMSKITPGLTTDRIEGGALRGQNLFHSFQEFNVNNNRSVYFVDPGGIQNIISRVTGNNRSEILGTLGVLGNSNLFLLNPNGIVFGQDSKLDIKGAFVATTGDSFLFDNNQTFSATNPQAPPLLLIKTPVGISFRDNQAQILTRSVSTRKNAPFPLNNLVGLAANTVNLIGGSLAITGGITANQINLAAVNQGTVGLNSDLSLSYDQALKFGEIAIDRGQIDASGNGAGTIDLRASNINLKDSQITAYTLGTIDGGAININTDNLNLNRSIIAASTFGTGRSGDLTIQAKEAVTIRGESLTRFQQTLDRLFFQGLGIEDPSLPKIQQPLYFSLKF
jgi:filamentous hemagglutinin family protein